MGDLHLRCPVIEFENNFKIMLLQEHQYINQALGIFQSGLPQKLKTPYIFQFYNPIFCCNAVGNVSYHNKNKMVR